MNLTDDLPPVIANAGELTQVMFNLLQNAREHTENGEVAINAQCTADNPRYIWIAVSDTGTGIPPGLLPRVFERGVSGREGGDGLGLAICKDIIDAHGGKIGIESEPGKGTTVLFTLQIEN